MNMNEVCQWPHFQGRPSSTVAFLVGSMPFGVIFVTMVHHNTQVVFAVLVKLGIE